MTMPKTFDLSQRLYSYLWALIAVMLLYSCGSDDDPTPDQNEYLISSTEVASYNSEILQLAASQEGLSSIADQLQYDITIYEIEYKTKYLDTEITASGLIGIPTTDLEVPVLSFQHGTIAAADDAPTQSNDGLFYASFASLGYVSLIPDFIGFGSSSDLVHPYYHEESTATSVIDMIRAGEEFMRENNISSNGKLFLAGYSEGGYATMATHKAIEEKYAEEFDLIASAPASGGYDLVGMKDYFVGLDTYHQPFYLAYIALSYSQTYDMSTLLSDIFNEPYATAIPALFDGSKSGSQINAALTDDLTELLVDDFRLNSDTNSKYSELLDKLETNSPLVWQPVHPVYMYHGTADITVPYENSQTSYSQLLDAGASSNLVTFTPLEGATHSTGVAPYVIHFTEVFAGLQ